MTTNTTPQTVIDFWFSAEVEKRWFNSTEDLDREIQDRFEPLWISAASRGLEDWRRSANGALALVIVLDQFPLNMFRNQAMAFKTEQQAVAVTKQAIQEGLDAELSGSRLAFLYMPLMHSESADDQELSVKLYERAGLDDNLKFARHHRDIVRRFGRFPHRNAILGRESSPEEMAYLKSPQAFKG